MTDQDELNRLRTAEQIRAALASILQNQAELRAEVGELRSESASIYTEVKKTNGRVTRSEDRISVLEMWRAKSAGIWAAIVTGAGVVAWLINQIMGYLKDQK